MPGVGPIDEEPETETEEVEEVEPEEEDLDYYNLHITNTCYPPTFFYLRYYTLLENQLEPDKL